MPPTSRRQKKFEKDLRRVQSRNIIAGLMFLLAIVGSFFLIRQLIPENKPTIHVSINRINHSGTREIPFSDESCKMVKRAFAENLACKTDPEVHELDEQQSDLKMISRDIGPGDVLIVYLNGHLADANSRPTALGGQPSAATPDGEENADDEVYWIAPESGAVEEKLEKLSDLLKPINDSNALIKVVLLDAGRYSWSPTFPGRATNEFQSRLDQLLKSNAWGFDDNFWIITSHSDGEISNVSTPLKSSLFAVAIEESLKTLAMDKQTDLQVPRLFQEIKKFTSSYSRNFEDKALQNPVLMKVGKGIVERVSTPAESPLIVTWQNKAEPATDENPPPKEYEWREFAESPTAFSQWIFESNHYPAIPKQVIEKVELFLEQGNEKTEWTSTAQQTLDQFKKQLTDFSKSPLVPTDFDLESLNQKQLQVTRFRRALLEFSIFARFRNQMRFWDDNAFEKIPALATNVDLATPLRLNDDLLTEPKMVPRIESLPTRLETFLADNEMLIETVERIRKKNSSLSPMQAELLGVLSQRYLPLIEQFQANLNRTKPEAEAKPEPLPKTFTLALTPDATTDRYDPENMEDKLGPGAGIKAVVTKGKEELGAIFPRVGETETDTSYRYSLASRGSEFSKPNPGVAPNIKWTLTRKQISIESRSSESVFKVPFFEQKKIQFDLNTSAVDAVDLAIAQTSSEKLEGLNFGFDKDFVGVRPITELDNTGQPFKRTKSFEVFFQYPKPDSTMIGKRFDFEILATDRKDSSEKPYSFRFAIQITKDAEFRITSQRTLANRSNDRSSVRLYRWGTPPIESEWEPLALRTLANVKSPFEFSLTNNSETPQKFTAKLYLIKRFPVGIREDLLSSDRRDFAQLNGFVQHLATQSKSAGIPPLDRGEDFELIGVTTVDLPNAMSTAPMRFLPPPKDPNAAADATPPGFVQIEKGLILALHSELREDDAPGKNPDWYQLLFFEPQEPANATRLKQNKLKIKPDIVDKFGPVDIQKLPDSLAPSVNENQAAQLTIVSKNEFVENRNRVESLKLTDVLAGDGAELPSGNSPALLLLEALGVPNYMTYQTNGITLTSTALRRQLTGVRISKRPSHWTCYPNSWSFAADAPPGPPFEWLADRSSNIQDIYVRIGEHDGPGAGEGELEFFLPFKDDDVLLGRSDDFWIRWQGGERKLQYPNERKHFISITESGMSSWSEVRSHSIEISNIADRILELGRENSDQPLGRWRFVTQSPGLGPKLTATQMEFEQTIAQVGSTIITLDVSEIKPAVSPDEIKLSMDGLPMEKNKLKTFLQENNEGRGRYGFSLLELRAAFENPPLDPKTVIKAETTDFFGETNTNTLRLTINKVKPEAPKPKPATLEISFAHGGDTPVDLLSFSSVQLNGSTIALDQLTPFNGSSIKINSSKEAPSLRITGLFPGKYSIRVDGLIKRQGSNQYTPATAEQAGIAVAEDGAKATLLFK